MGKKKNWSFCKHCFIIHPDKPAVTITHPLGQHNFATYACSRVCEQINTICSQKRGGVISAADLHAAELAGLADRFAATASVNEILAEQI